MPVKVVPDAPDQSADGLNKKAAPDPGVSKESRLSGVVRTAETKAKNNFKNVYYPAFKRGLFDFVVDIGSTGLRMLLGLDPEDTATTRSGETMRTRDGRVYRKYNTVSNNPFEDSRPAFDRSVEEYESIQFRSSDLAEVKLRKLRDTLASRREHFVTVGDFYQICGYPTTSVDDLWGWYDLSTARVEPKWNGQHKIVFPPLQPIR